MEKLQKFYEEVVDFVNYCAIQDFIPEDEEEYIVSEITKIRDKIIDGKE